eukprot:CAMPEP_0113941512 /NCGR_PEP_ID=MMETSP1339-20121228/7410_1 /TAXON_ID=94617 /ORGANISM="Fibrocapsa japonica" /LENGTH=167 /DNA_ID=CAMNT_0000945681 /DNA_START=56 /DNA_END=559 /DNA_ORIENTATION=- /assembly_acc=CAM_ASM_000762
MAIMMNARAYILFILIASSCVQTLNAFFAPSNGVYVRRINQIQSSRVYRSSPESPENIEEEVEKPTPANEEIADEGPCPGFPKCSGKYRDGGCDGTGRMQGGIATVPGFGWWPIKVYRPCPAYLTAGYKYKRQGQSLSEVAFKQKGEGDDLLITERLQGLSDEDKKE